MVEAVERAIGFRLPPLVRRIYLEIADGGVGPFSGFSPLDDDGWRMPGPPPDMDEAELAQYPADPPPGVVFFCDFGCARWALLDCRHPEGQMWWWQEGDRHKLDLTFPQWETPCPHDSRVRSQSTDVSLSAVGVTGAVTRPSPGHGDPLSVSSAPGRGAEARRSAVTPPVCPRRSG